MKGALKVVCSAVQKVASTVAMMAEWKVDKTVVLTAAK